jgi:hypothetical protein
MRTNRANNDIRIKLMRGGIENSGLSDLTFAYTSGNEYKLGVSTGLQNVSFPVYLKIKFRAWNHFIRCSMMSSSNATSMSLPHGI